MLNQKDVRREVLTAVQAHVDLDEDIPVEWLVHAIVQEHDDIKGADAEWHTVTAFMAIRTEMRHALHVSVDSPRAPRRRVVGSDVEADEAPQGELFDRLQPAYLVKRGKEVWLVPRARLSDAELYAKADEYDAFGEGARQHAEQLRRYAAKRAA